MAAKCQPSAGMLLAVVRGCAREARRIADDEAGAAEGPDEVCEAVAASLEQLVIALEGMFDEPTDPAAEAAADN